MRVLPTWLVCGLFALAACGGSQNAQPTTGGPLTEEPAEAQPRGPVSASGSGEVTAIVGSAGGTLSLSNGARLEIPAGALSRDVEITFHVGADGQAFGDAERQRPLGPMLGITPALAAENGASFVLSIPSVPVPTGFQSDDLAFAMEETDEGARAIDTIATQTRWQFYHVQVDGGRFVARTQGFPGHRVRFGVAR